MGAMSISETAVKTVHFLTRSPTRVRILTLAYEHDHLETRELKDRIDRSRITVRRNIEALTQRDLLRSDNRICTITPLGELVVEEIIPAIEVAGTVERLRPFVRWFPDDELGFDLRALEEATVVVSETDDPYAPVHRHVRTMQAATTFRSLLPTVGLFPMTAAHECILESGQTQEVIVDPAIATTLREEPKYRSIIAELLATDRCTVFVSQTVIPYYVGICDLGVQIGVEDTDGMPRALVETTAEEVREWAEQTYEHRRSMAKPFEL